MKNPFAVLTRLRDRLIDHQPSVGATLENLDGVRALAVLMVFNQHTALFPKLVLGSTGVWLFFTLSGYLLYLVFLRLQQPLPDSRLMVAYLIRRVFRIVPLYLLALLVLAWWFQVPRWDFNSAWFVNHVYFIYANHHLWTIKTEMAFYVFLPLIIVLLAPFKQPLPRVILLLLLAFAAWWVFEYKKLLTLRHSSAYFAPFLIGMAMVHVQPLISRRLGPVLVVLGLLGIAAFGSDYAWAARYRALFDWTNLGQTWLHGWLVYGPCAMVLVGAAAYKSRIWGNPWLRLIGVVGYGYYLWHWVVIQFLFTTGITGAWFHVLAFLGSLAAAIISYVAVERPGIELGKRVARWVLQDSLWLRLRPVTVCLLLLSVFLCLRHFHNFDPRIEVEYELLADENTLTQVFITSDRDFSERLSAYQRIPGGSWQSIALRLPDMPVSMLRFDPGDNPGVFRVRNLRVWFPYSRGWRELPVDALEPLAGVAETQFRDGVLTIRTEPDNRDPILIYGSDIGQPLLRHGWAQWLALLSTFLLLFLAGKLLDRIAGRFGERLKGNDLLPARLAA